MSCSSGRPDGAVAPPRGRSQRGRRSLFGCARNGGGAQGPIWRRPRRHCTNP
ncbi:hypothetical protein MLP_22220 [Microlunatus phosphovorus NM-1]|uniref:Uncharacterized protein n=1 Tax=Microlunatus phosphovorus (strain ATCC 700054 / DSM 10555 / JCM 9379 / NBRC 101784 / NCIMB 13414 / VKM Ac-1990 / NM-1) TaxID=1032480 RepID=F5XEM0_MICPN|nr:hypothetical protein MLP_22220 [Microlunatus phosphovorus NM-1]